MFSGRTIDGMIADFSSYTLCAGPYTAVLSTLGAGIARLTLHGRDLLMVHDPLTVPDGYSGQVLIPWPNRLRDGKYSWDGVEYELPCNDEGTHTALHGLCADRQWAATLVEESCVEFSLFVEPVDGFPWAFSSTVRYSLDADRGLTVCVSTTNQSDTPMPYGVSHHPYLMPGGGSVDEWTVTAPAGSVYEADDQLIPVRKHDVAVLGHDYRAGRAMTGVSVDHCFSDLPEGEWIVRVESKSRGVAVLLHSDARWLQMYSGDFIGRAGIAVEPMSCPPNALASGDDLVVLSPGQEHSFTFRVSGDIA